MTDNYLIFYQPYWTDSFGKRTWIKRDVKLYFNPVNKLPDKRRKEYKELLKTRPTPLHWMGANVKFPHA